MRRGDMIPLPVDVEAVLGVDVLNRIFKQWEGWENETCGTCYHPYWNEHGATLGICEGAIRTPDGGARYCLNRPRRETKACRRWRLGNNKEGT